MEPCTYCGRTPKTCKCTAHLECDKVGLNGHAACGFCLRCLLPRYLCGHAIFMWKHSPQDVYNVNANDVHMKKAA